MPAIHDPQDHFIFARDAQSRLTPTDTQKTTLIVAGCYIIAIAILWYVRALALVLIDIDISAHCRHVPYLKLISECGL